MLQLTKYKINENQKNVQNELIITCDGCQTSSNPLVSKLLYLCHHLFLTINTLILVRGGGRFNHVQVKLLDYNTHRMFPHFHCFVTCFCIQITQTIYIPLMKCQLFNYQKLQGNYHDHTFEENKEHQETLLQKWGAIYQPKSLWDLKSEIISLHFTDFTLVKVISL